MRVKNKDYLFTLFIVLSIIFTLSLAITILLPAIIETDESINTIALKSNSMIDPYGTLSQNESKKWFDSGNPLQGAQYDGTLTNPSTFEITSWQIQFEIPENAYISDSWNGIYTVNDKLVTIDPPKEYNQIIPPGGNITYGFIMYAPKSFVPGEVTLRYRQKIEISHAWYYYAIVLISIISGSSLIICLPYICNQTSKMKKNLI